MYMTSGEKNVGQNQKGKIISHNQIEIIPLGTVSSTRPTNEVGRRF